jgi:hypothetical protein
VSVKAVPAAASWLIICFLEPPKASNRFRAAAQATRRASRRGFRGISSVAALPAVFHDPETPSVTPACKRAETLPEALRARGWKPQSEAAPRSR